MEWFRRPDGSIAISEVGARPPGSQFMTLMSYAHDTDLYAAWARLAVDGVFDPPQRSYACGGAYLRAQGSGRAIVWTGPREPAELYWEQLSEAGLTMAPLEQH